MKSATKFRFKGDAHIITKKFHTVLQPSFKGTSRAMHIHIITKKFNTVLQTSFKGTCRAMPLLVKKNGYCGPLAGFNIILRQASVNTFAMDLLNQTQLRLFFGKVSQQRGISFDSHFHGSNTIYMKKAVLISREPVTS